MSRSGAGPAAGVDGAGLLAGIDVGGTRIRAVLCTPELDVADRAAVRSPASEGGSAMVDAAVELVRTLRRRNPGADVVGIGIGAAGVIEATTGRVLAASDSFRSWVGFDIAAALQTGLGLDPFVDNDVNCFLRGEVAAGAVRGADTALGVSLGTGVGGALWLRGRMWDGERGAAGEIGHMPGFGTLPCTCGGHGHLETLAAGRQLARRYAERTGRDLDAGGVAARARAGDPAAVAVFETAGVGLARAVLVATALLDVSTAVVGGGVSAAWDLLSPAVSRTLAAEPAVSGADVRIVRSGLGTLAAAVGAAAGARAAHAGRAEPSTAEPSTAEPSTAEPSTDESPAGDRHRSDGDGRFAGRGALG